MIYTLRISSDLDASNCSTLHPVSKYQQLRILHIEFAEAFSGGFIPYINIVTAFTLIGGCHIPIRYHDILPIEVLIMLLELILFLAFVSFTIYPKKGEIAVNSAAFIYSMKVKFSTTDFVIRKQIKACPVIKVKIGQFLHSEKWTNFQISGFVIYWTARSLILIKPILSN